MERASNAFLSWFMDHYENNLQVSIVAGTGNNGGDGLAIARLLHHQGYQIKCFVIRGGVPESVDFARNLERLREVLPIVEISEDSQIQQIDDPDVIIDGIFGSGISRPVEGLYLGIVNYIKNSVSEVVSIDMPSGLYCDDHTPGLAINATHTVSFQRPKLAFMVPQNGRYVGDWHVVDIGLDEGFIEEMDTDLHLIDEQQIRSFIQPRKKYSHKGTYGRALLVGGSSGKMGAAVLASKACMRSGPGLLTVQVPGCGYGILQNSIPEAMVLIDEGEKFIESVFDVERFSTLGIGPGLDKQQATVKMMSRLLPNLEYPIVVDADAINILAENRELIHHIPAHSILTPHPLEFERLLGEELNDFEKLKKGSAFCIDHQLFIVLKGAHTAVLCPDGRIFFNNTGNPGMATGGSGDVLTGMITGLLAQDYSSFQAALIGVHLHGLAGDLACEKFGEHSLIASDIVSFISEAFLRVS
jgi:NAD(P)H-hydrate epimerase